MKTPFYEHLFAVLFLHTVFMYQTCVQPHLSYVAVPTSPSAAVLPLPSPNPSIPPSGLSPLCSIMLTCPSTEPLIVIAFNTRGSSHSLPGAHNILCQLVFASISCVTAAGQLTAAEEKRHKKKKMQSSEHARCALNNGVRTGMSCTSLLISRNKKF